MIRCFILALVVLFTGSQAGVINNNEPVRKCPSKWIANNGTCYYIEKTTRRTFEQAKASCINEGGTLFVPQSIKENDFIMSKIAEMAFTWNGLSQTKAAPKWERKSKLNFSQFDWDEPDSVQSSESSTPHKCAVAENIHGRRNLYWTSCNEEHFYICEEKNKTQVFNRVRQNDQPITKKSSKCETGWFQFEDSCYFYERMVKVGLKCAQTACNNRNATLFIPKTFEELETVLAHSGIETDLWELPIVIIETNGKKKTSKLQDLFNIIKGTCSVFIEEREYTYDCNMKFSYVCEKKISC